MILLLYKNFLYVNICKVKIKIIYIYILFYFCSFYTRPRLKVLFNLSITSNYRSILSWKVLSILCPIRYCLMETTCIITLNIKVVCPYKRHSDFLMHCFPLIENKEKLLDEITFMYMPNTSGNMISLLKYTRSYIIFHYGNFAMMKCCITAKTSQVVDILKNEFESAVLIFHLPKYLEYHNI